MNDKCVKDIMVPLDAYPTVSQEATLIEAVLKFEDAQKRRDRSRQPYRAILVVDENGKVIGKLGQLAFLKALEPKQNILGDMGKLAVAGVSSEFIKSMMEHFRFFQDDLSYLCQRARYVKVREIMQPVTDSIDENASMGEAISRLVALQTLSILVSRGTEIIGLLRLSDVCQEVAEQMKILA
jgi:CBS-domain-containing membrane protein